MQANALVRSERRSPRVGFVALVLLTSAFVVAVGQVARSQSLQTRQLAEMPTGKFHWRQTKDVYGATRRERNRECMHGLATESGSGDPPLGASAAAAASTESGSGDPPLGASAAATSSPRSTGSIATLVDDDDDDVSRPTQRRDCQPEDIEFKKKTAGILSGEGDDVKSGADERGFPQTALQSDPIAATEEIRNAARRLFPVDAYCLTCRGCQLGSIRLRTFSFKAEHLSAVCACTTISELRSGEPSEAERRTVLFNIKRLCVPPSDLATRGGELSETTKASYRVFAEESFFAGLLLAPEGVVKQCDDFEQSASDPGPDVESPSKRVRATTSRLEESTAALASEADYWEKATEVSSDDMVDTETWDFEVYICDECYGVLQNPKSKSPGPHFISNYNFYGITPPQLLDGVSPLVGELFASATVLQTLQVYYREFVNALGAPTSATALNATPKIRGTTRIVFGHEHGLFHEVGADRDTFPHNTVYVTSDLTREQIDYVKGLHTYLVDKARLLWRFLCSSHKHLRNLVGAAETPDLPSKMRLEPGVVVLGVSSDAFAAGANVEGVPVASVHLPCDPPFNGLESRSEPGEIRFRPGTQFANITDPDVLPRAFPLHFPSGWGLVCSHRKPRVGFERAAFFVSRCRSGWTSSASSALWRKL